MRRRKAFSPIINPLEARVCLNGDVVQEGDFQGEFGDQTTPDSPGSSGGELAAEQASGLTSVQTSAKPAGTISTAAPQASTTALRPAGTVVTAVRHPTGPIHAVVHHPTGTITAAQHHHGGGHHHPQPPPRHGDGESKTA